MALQGDWTLEADQVLATVVIFSEPIQGAVVALHLGLVRRLMRANEVVLDP